MTVSNSVFELCRDMDTLGNVLKHFEKMGEHVVPAGMPLVARLDGHSFHTFTKGLKRPFDLALKACMEETALALATRFNACLAYTQSDEITLLFENSLSFSQGNNSLTSLPFSGRAEKILTLMAAYGSVRFNKLIATHLPQKADIDAAMDCRLLALPSMELAACAVVWREQDCTKNAISMVASSYFPHGVLQGASSAERIEMLHQKGINFNDYDDTLKRGTFFLRKKIPKAFSAEELATIPEKHRPVGPVLRTVYLKTALPRLMSIGNLVDVLTNPSELDVMDQDQQKLIKKLEI